MAKNIVAAGLAEKVEVQVAYAIGVARPLSLLVETFGTEQVPLATIRKLVDEHFDLRPAAFRRHLQLQPADLRQDRRLRALRARRSRLHLGTHRQGRGAAGGGRTGCRGPGRRGVGLMGFPTDLEIAKAAKLLPLDDIAAEMGIDPHLVTPYGRHVAKIELDAIDELADRPKAKYVVVSAVTPTPLGEGKTTTTVGLGQAMRRIGRRATVALRQPSMGPTFGIKGGAAGGGYSQVVPMETLNLHLTGDFHAVTAAHNMLSAVLDNHLFQGNDCGIDPHNITWRRVLDVNDRVLRNVIVGLGSQAWTASRGRPASTSPPRPR